VKSSVGLLSGGDDKSGKKSGARLQAVFDVLVIRDRASENKGIMISIAQYSCRNLVHCEEGWGNPLFAFTDAGIRAK
jgi:hypothetical protein